MKFNFIYTEKLVDSLLKIEKYKMALENLNLPIRAKQKMVHEAKIKKTYFSTSIEGNLLTISQVEEVVKKRDISSSIYSVREVQDYWDVLTFLEYSCEDKKTIDKEFIFDLYGIVQKNGITGKIEFRNQPPGVLLPVHDKIMKSPEYIPPQSSDIPLLINELIMWYNSNSCISIPIKAAIFHYAFVTIHPFQDGNGKVARALATYVLMTGNYDFKGLSCFEEYYMADLDNYYSSLQMGLPPLFYEGRENPPHLEIWLEYFCEIMALNAEKIYSQTLELSKKDTCFIIDGLMKKDLLLIRYCLENNKSIVKNKELAEFFGVTPRAISKWMVEWVSKGILESISGKERITAYKLKSEFMSLTISDLGFDR